MIKKFMALVMLVAAILQGGCSQLAQTDDKAAQASPVAERLPTFSAKTLDGTPVTNEIFAAKKLTVVNIWGTFCPPCIGEMPALGEWTRTLPADVQLIGLVCDAAENSPNQIQKAQNIIKEAGADFMNIVPDGALMRFMEGVEAVPTTIFVNGKGEVVGKAIIGANVAGYKNELEQLLKN